MAHRVLFLSHIHEEKELALIFKEVLENEFSGFVDVFVSSDGISIPAGSNFLQKIEAGLVDCIGAIALISQISAKRHWISFELGALWIRNVLSRGTDGAEIPIVPLCHSGMHPSILPTPLNLLNAITATNAKELEHAFRSLQTAAGGRGALSTNFDLLGEKIRNFESSYILGASVVKMIKMLAKAKMDNYFGSEIVSHCKNLPSSEIVTIDCGILEKDMIKDLKDLEYNVFKRSVKVAVGGAILQATDQGFVNGGYVKIQIPCDLIQKFKDDIVRSSCA